MIARILSLLGVVVDDLTPEAAATFIINATRERRTARDRRVNP